MAKIKAVKFHSDYCESGKVKYQAGTVLPQNEESQRCVALNFAELVSVDEKQLTDPEAEKAAADKAAQDEIGQPEPDKAAIASPSV